MSDEGRYSKVTRRMWNDAKVRALSPPPPSAFTLWQRVLTGPELGVVPGLFAAHLPGLAAALRWPLEPTAACWEEIASKGMARADWDAGLVWVPNAIVHNEPESPNVVLAWRLALVELPECDLKREAVEALRTHLTEKGPAWLEAFAIAIGETKAKPREKTTEKPTRKPSRKASDKPPHQPTANQDQEQDQEQDSGSGDSTTTAPRVGLPERLLSKARSEGRPPKREDPTFTKLHVKAWFPSTEFLAWARAAGLTDDDVDRVLTALRDKTTGVHDFAWLDDRALSFFEAEIEHKRRPPSARRGPAPARPDTGWRAKHAQGSSQ